MTAYVDYALGDIVHIAPGRKHTIDLSQGWVGRVQMIAHTHLGVTRLPYTSADMPIMIDVRRARLIERLGPDLDYDLEMAMDCARDIQEARYQDREDRAVRAVKERTSVEQ